MERAQWVDAVTLYHDLSRAQIQAVKEEIDTYYEAHGYPKVCTFIGRVYAIEEFYIDLIAKLYDVEFEALRLQVDKSNYGKRIEQ